MPKPALNYQHPDQYGTPIETGNLVAFTMAYSNRVHIGRVARQTARRIRIEFVHEYRTQQGELRRFETDYQARPDGVVVLNNIDQNLTVLALKGRIK